MSGETMLVLIVVGTLVGHLLSLRLASAGWKQITITTAFVAIGWFLGSGYAVLEPNARISVFVVVAAVVAGFLVKLSFTQMAASLGGLYLSYSLIFWIVIYGV